MSKLFPFCFALVLSLSCVSSLPFPTLRYTRTPWQMSQLNSAVVALVGKRLLTGEWDTYCSGVFVGNNSVLTAAHCVTPEAEEHSIFISVYDEGASRNYESEHYSFYVFKLDEDVDLAILRKTDDGNSLPSHHWLPLSSEAPTQGENVILIGHPLGLSWTLTAGVVSSSSRYGWDPEEGEHAPLYIQHAAQAYPGSSGGPLINYRNEVVGILVQGHRLAEYLSMSVHTDVINVFLKDISL